jgi:Protein of unknown function (DUF2612).
MNEVTWLDIFSVDNFRQIPNVRDNVSTALQSQYSHSLYRGINKAIHDNVDACTDIDNAFIEVANPETAKGVFLDWWGKRVGVNRYVTINGTKVRLDDDYFRFLLYYRALSNISNTTAFTINKLLSLLTGVNVYAVDRLNMSFDIYIYGAISDLMRTIIKEYGLLNRPAGVMLNAITIFPEPENQLGFFGSGLQPFNQAPFNTSYEV